jgi:hypothetical protein
MAVTNTGLFHGNVAGQEFGFTAVAGRTIVGASYFRDGSPGTDPPDGFTELASVNQNGLASDGIILYAKVAAGGETEANFSNPLTMGTPHASAFVECTDGLSGAVAAARKLGDSGTTNGTMSAGALTPAAGAPVLLLGFGNEISDGVLADPQFDPDAPWSLIIDDYGSEQHPRPFVIAGSIASATGSYEPEIPYADGNPFGHKWAMASVALSGTAPTPPVKPEFPILDPDFTPLDTLDDMIEWEVRIELKDVGSGRFVMNRYSDQATDAILKQGNWVQVVIPRIDTDPIFIWQMETGKTILLTARAENGGENVTWGGRGGLSLLARSVAWNESFVVPGPKDTVGVLVGPASTGGKAGQILKRFIDEATHVDRGVGDFGVRLDTLDLLTHDFDYTNDSDGNAWIVTPSTADLAAGRIGENGLYSVSKLINTGAIDIIMQPNLLLQAFNEYGRDLSSTTFASGKVRFVRGVNIAEQLERDVGHELVPTHMLIQGQLPAYGYAVSPSAAGRPTVEGFLQTEGSDPAFLEEVGLNDMAQRLRKGESVSFAVDVPIEGEEDELTGKYLPGPPGSNGHFWIGDTVTLHTGSTEYGDLNNEDVRIMAIVLSTDKANNLKCTVEVRWTRLLARSTPVASGRGAPDPRTTASGTNPVPVPAASTLHGHDHGALSGLTDDDHSQYVRHFIQVADPAASAREGDLWVEAS